MFDMFNKSRTPEDDFDEELMRERIAAALTECGLDPESRSFAAVEKMLCDDIAWYFENVRVHTAGPAR